MSSSKKSLFFRLSELYYKAALHFPLFLKKPAKTDPKKFLIVSEDNLGDFLMLTGVINAIKKKYNLSIAVQKELVPVAKIMGADKIFPFDKKLYRHSIKYRMDFLNSLRKEGFFIAASSILFTALSVKITADSGAENRYVYVGNEGAKEKRRLVHINRKVKQINDRNESGMFKDVLEIISYYYSQITGIKIDYKKDEPCIKIDLPPYPGLESEKYLLYVSDTSAKIKTYPPEILIPALKKFALRHRLKLVITAVKNNNGFENEQGIINLAGKTSLEDMIRIVNSATVVIGNDTGMTHFAWIAGRPVLVIYGGGFYGRFSPHGRGRKIYNYMPCFLSCSWNNCAYMQSGIGKCIVSIPKEKIMAELEKLYNDECSKIA